MTPIPSYMRSYGYDTPRFLAGTRQSNTEIESGSNSGKVAQVTTVAISAATNSKAYTVTLNGVAITYTSDSSATQAEIATGLANAINAEPGVSGDVRAVAGATSVVVTSRIPGQGFTLTESDGELSTTATTANADAARIPFGYGVLAVGDGLVGLPSGTRTAAAAKVMTATPVQVNNALYWVTVTMLGGDQAGEGYMFQYTADASATVQEIVEGLTAGLNALLPASTVVVTEDDTALTFTSEVAGIDFTVEAGSNSSSATWTIATTTANAAEAGALAYPFRGVAVRSHTADENLSHLGGTADGESYPPESTVGVAIRGPIPVRLASDMSSLAAGDSVYLTYSDSGTGSAGEFRNDADSGYAVALTGCRFETAAEEDLNGNLVALLHIDHRTAS